MKNIKKSILGYLIAFLAFELLGFLFVSNFSKLEQMKFINSHNSLFFDWFFWGITQTAEYILPIAFLFYLWKRHMELLKPYVFSYAVSTFFVQILKHWIFSGALRPIAYLADAKVSWHLKDGLFINTVNSFPSGHTNAAWWMYFWMAYLMPKKWMGFGMGCLAFGVAYSRVYLFQHFPIDTLVGAAFGCLISLFMYQFYADKLQKHV